MGYSIDLFTHPDSLDKEFICSICHDVMKHPVMSKACDHIYCSSCIATWRSNHKPATCPIDRKPMRGLRPPIRAYMNMYNALSLKCSFDGCGASELNLGNIEGHAGSCVYNPEGIAPCGSGCGATLKMKEIPNHVCVAWLKGQLSLKETEMEKMKERHASTGANYVKLLGMKNGEINKLKAELSKKDGQIQTLQKAAQVKAPAPVPVPGGSSSKATTTTTNANATAAPAAVVAPKRMKMEAKGEETSSEESESDDDGDGRRSRLHYLMLGMLLGKRSY